MDLNELNKSQLVLLTLLISFVTSIATGIVTVSLMEQAPPTIAQTVNRVVERTVERVVPAAQEASVITPTITEKTVIVKESDFIAGALNAVTPGVVRLYALSKDPSVQDGEVFLGFGAVMSAEGLIAADIASTPLSGQLIIEKSDGSRATGTPAGRFEDIGLLMIQAATSSEDGDAPSWQPVQLTLTTPNLGDAVISLAGKTTTRIGNGIVSALPTDGDDAHLITYVETSVPQGAVAFGSVVVNAKGEVIGISTATSRQKSETTFLASSMVLMYTADHHEDGETSQ